MNSENPVTEVHCHSMFADFDDYMNLKKQYRENLQLLYVDLEKENDPWVNSFLEFFKLFADNLTFEDDDLILDILEDAASRHFGEVDSKLKVVVKDITKLIEENYGKEVTQSMVEESKNIITKLNRTSE